MKEVSGHHTPEELYGLYGDDLEQFMSEQSTNSVTSVATEAQTKANEPATPLVHDLGKVARSGQCVEVYDHHGFYQAYEIDAPSPKML